MRKTKDLIIKVKENLTFINLFNYNLINIIIDNTIHKTKS